MFSGRLRFGSDQCVVRSSTSVIGHRRMGIGWERKERKKEAPSARASGSRAPHGDPRARPDRCPRGGSCPPDNSPDAAWARVRRSGARARSPVMPPAALARPSGGSKPPSPPGDFAWPATPPRPPHAYISPGIGSRFWAGDQHPPPAPPSWFLVFRAARPRPPFMVHSWSPPAL